MILLVVDMQEGIVDEELYAFDTFMDRTVRLIDAARKSGTINSCFGCREFREYMEKQEDSRLMIIGLQTNYCIDATVKSAFERGYTVIIPEGTNTTFDNDYMTGETTVRYYNEDIWEELVESVSLEEALEMLEKE